MCYTALKNICHIAILSYLQRFFVQKRNKNNSGFEKFTEQLRESIF